MILNSSPVNFPAIAFLFSNSFESIKIIFADLTSGSLIKLSYPSSGLNSISEYSISQFVFFVTKLNIVYQKIT